MLRVDRVPVYKRVYTLQYVVQAAYNTWHEAKGLFANKVAALEVKQAELEAKVSEMQMAISNLQSALANLSTRMDANEKLDEKQQEQIDSMKRDIARILEHLSLE